MAHKMCIEDNRGTLISEMHKGVSRGACPFWQNISKPLVFRCILLQPLRRDRLTRRSQYTTGAIRSTTALENKKAKREYRKNIQERYTEIE